jgi:hypothetical protein
LSERAHRWTALIVGVIGASASIAAYANTAPQISGAPSTSIPADEFYSFRPTASDAEQQPLTFDIVNKPAWANFDPATGRLYGTPATTYSGITFVDVRISVSDGSARRYLPAFDIRVDMPNRPPVITGAPLSFVPAGKAFTFTPKTSDPDSQPLTYTVSNKPPWATFATGTGRLQGTPAAHYAGQVYTGIRICVSDGFVSVCMPQFQLRVMTSNSAPTLTGVPSTRVAVGESYRFTPVATDPDSNPLTYVIQNKPAWATFNASTGQLTGVPETRYGGTTARDIQIGVFDGYLKTWLPAFSIDVVEPATTRTVTLNWAAPKKRTDGSPLVDVRGYTIYYGVAADHLPHHLFVSGAVVTSAVIEDLPPATWYFALRTVTRDDSQSVLSGVVSKRVR